MLLHIERLRVFEIGCAYEKIDQRLGVQANDAQLFKLPGAETGKT